MYRYLKYKLVILIVFAATYIAKGQTGKPVNYTTLDGLPSSEIYDLEFDKENRLWITTDRGVSRYDGYTFKNYNINDGLGDNTNFEIIKDKNGKLWFTGYNGSISFFNGTDFEQVDYDLNNRNNYKSNKGWVDDIIALDDNKYLFKIKQFIDELNQIFIYDTKTKVQQEITLDKGIDKEFIFIDSLNIFYDQKFSSIYLNKSDHKNNSTNLRASNPTETQKITRIYNDSIIIKTLSNHSNSIESEIIDSILYVCTFDGIEMYNIHDAFAFKGKLLAGNITTFIIKGPSNNLWVSTQNKGLYKISQTKIKELKFPIDLKPLEVTTTEDHIFIGCRNGNGIYSYNKALENQFQVKGKLAYFQTLAKSDDTLITSNLKKIVIKNGKPILLNPEVRKKNGFIIQRRIILKLKNKKYFLGGLSTKIADSEYNKIEDLANYYKVRNVYQDKKEDIYFATPSSLHIIRNYNLKNIENISDKIELLDVRITEIKGIENQGLIFSTLGNGIIFKHYNEEEPQKISTEDGLISNLVNDVFIEGDSVLWAGTNDGISRISFSIRNNTLIIKNIKTLDKQDGLASNYIHDIDTWNGFTWVVTQGGINYLKFDELKENLSNPSLILEPPSMPGLDTVLIEGCTLSATENDLEFNYTGVHYSKPQNEKFYRYSLLVNQQEDTTWTFTDSRVAQFTNLGHGGYTFLVNAKNNQGQWSPDFKEFNFKIKPELTETIAFKIGTLLLVLLGLIIYKIHREKNLLKESKQVQALKNAEIKFKQAELNALRNQMNPHFIFNALNSIQNFIFKNDPKKANYLLSRFGTLIRKSLDLSKLNFITVKEEISFLENYLELEKMRFEDKFDYTITKGKNVTLSEKLPPLLLQPIIENSIKHGFSNIETKGLITINFSKTSTYLKIQVTDNGTGIKEVVEKDKREQKPHALYIIRERINIINESNGGKGSFKIKPLMDGNKTSGTEVSFLFSITN